MSASYIFSAYELFSMYTIGLHLREVLQGRWHQETDSKSEESECEFFVQRLKLFQKLNQVVLLNQRIAIMQQYADKRQFRSGEDLLCSCQSTRFLEIRR